jgi:hypothetical protein
MRRRTGRDSMSGSAWRNPESFLGDVRLRNFSHLARRARNGIFPGGDDAPKNTDSVPRNREAER